MRHIRFHDLRHSILTYLAKHFTPKTVQGYARHANCQTMLDIYCHSYENDTQAELNCFCSALDFVGSPSQALQEKRFCGRFQRCLNMKNPCLRVFLWLRGQDLNRHQNQIFCLYTAVSDIRVTIRVIFSEIQRLCTFTLPNNRIKIPVNNLVKPYTFIAESLLINAFQNVVRRPTAPLHSIFVGNAEH